jgi:hypothetical protein
MFFLKLPRLLLIAGNGRDSGKTTFACGIIRKFCSGNPIIALKISPHRHKISPCGEVICDSDKLYIVEEMEKTTGKDTSRMLAAGAGRSFLIVAEDEQLLPAVERIMNLVVPDAFLVCESGGLRQVAEPGLFFIVNRTGNKDFKPATRELLPYDHTAVPFDGWKFHFNLDEIVISQQGWEKKTSS